MKGRIQITKGGSSKEGGMRIRHEKGMGGKMGGLIGDESAWRNAGGKEKEGSGEGSS